MKRAWRYAKNKGMGHDKAVFHFLETRLDTVILRAWLANTIMQARQIVTHWHLLLNGKKHNIPSYHVAVWDIIEVRKKSQNSTLFADTPLVSWNHAIPSYIKINKKSLVIEVVGAPSNEEVSVPVDILKVIEFYARA
jgi:small subunit ribosomal protein S4